MQAVILMGGEGSRLRPLTWDLPKAMLPVLNTPFLDHLIGYLQTQGITDILLALGYQSPAIERHVREKGFRARVRCFTEQSPLGTAGAVKNLAPYLEDDFFVLNGDIFTDLDLKAMLHFHRRQESKLTIALTSVDDPSRFGVVNTDGQCRVTAFVEKPLPGIETTHYINAGVYLMQAEVIERVAPGPFMLERGLFPDLVNRGDAVFGFAFSGYWLDMGTPEHYLKLNHDLLLRKGTTPPATHPGVKLQGPVQIGDGVTIEQDVKLIGPTVLGPGCHIGQGSTVDSSVLWEGAKLGREATVAQSVIAAHSLVGDGCHLERCVLGPGLRLEAGRRPKPGSRLGPEPRKQLQPQTS